MRLVLAARQSQRVDNQTGWDTQDEDGRLWAVRQGHAIAGVAPDRISGRVSPFQRKHLGPWLNDPNRMLAYEGILATRIDRLTRRRDWDLRQWAENNHKKILIVNPELVWPPDPGDAATPIIWDNLVNIAVSEWENTSRNYKRMQKALRDQGYLVGRAPYGYRAIGVECRMHPCVCKNDHKTLEPDPITAPIVRDIAARYLSGQSSREIRDWLKLIDAPVPLKSKQGNGQGWREHHVLYILHNPATKGRIQHEGKTYMRVDPLVSPEDFRTIQEMTEARRKMPGIVRKETAMLTSMLRCDRGVPMYRIKTEPRRRCPDGVWYYCNENLCPKGSRLLVPLAEIERAVDEAISSYTDMAHMVTTVTPGDTYGEEIRQLKLEQAGLDTEDEGQFKQYQALREEILRLRALPRKPAIINPKADGKSVAEVWDSLSPAGKRQWLLARRPSGWLPDESIGQPGARIQVFGRDPDTDVLIVSIDIGEYTEFSTALQNIGEDE